MNKNNHWSARKIYVHFTEKNRDLSFTLNSVGSSLESIQFQLVYLVNRSKKKQFEQTLPRLRFKWTMNFRSVDVDEKSTLELCFCYQWCHLNIFCCFWFWSDSNRYVAIDEYFSKHPTIFFISLLKNWFSVWIKMLYPWLVQMANKCVRVYVFKPCLHVLR